MRCERERERERETKSEEEARERERKSEGERARDRWGGGRWGGGRCVGRPSHVWEGHFWFERKIFSPNTNPPAYPCSTSRTGRKARQWNPALGRRSTSSCLHRADCDERNCGGGQTRVIGETSNFPPLKHRKWEEQRRRMSPSKALYQGCVHSLIVGVADRVPFRLLGIARGQERHEAERTQHGHESACFRSDPRCLPLPHVVELGISLHAAPSGEWERRKLQRVRARRGLLKVEGVKRVEVCLVAWLG